MVHCFDCGCLTEYVLPHGVCLPVYCPECLHDLRSQLVKDLAARKCLLTYLLPGYLIRRRLAAQAAAMKEEKDALASPAADAGQLAAS